MSIAGALLFISVGIGGASLNIYTEVGLVTLMGLISKHGILIVEFANAEQMAGKSKREAIEAACGIRLRPILMTTAAMVLGVIPLITATGAGAVSRFNMGLVIASGLTIGTLFTLFVVPAVYLLIAAEHHNASDESDAAGKPEAAGAKLEDGIRVGERVVTACKFSRAGFRNGRCRLAARRATGGIRGFVAPRQILCGGVKFIFSWRSYTLGFRIGYP